MIFNSIPCRIWLQTTRVSVLQGTLTRTALRTLTVKMQNVLATAHVWTMSMSLDVCATKDSLEKTVLKVFIYKEKINLMLNLFTEQILTTAFLNPVKMVATTRCAHCLLPLFFYLFFLSSNSNSSFNFCRQCKIPLVNEGLKLILI